MRKLTSEEFTVKATALHNNKYDYSKVSYINNRTKITILCPSHGEFEQKANNHLLGQGCPKCAGNNPLNKEKFINKAVAIHNNKYYYVKVNYTSNNIKVIITCKLHGDFEQTPHNHLNGQGCPECACKKQTKTTEQFIAEAVAIHGDKYDYNKVNYVNSHTKITILCPVHGIFEQKPYNHLCSNGCPSCAITGFDKSKPAVLYYLKITTDDNLVLYKIGITNRTINERFNLTELTKIEIVKQKLYENGQDAYDLEQKALKQFKKFKYVGPNILKYGNTELFTKDIMAIQ